VVVPPAITHSLTVPVTAITPPLTITAVTAVIAVPPYGGERDGVSESYTFGEGGSVLFPAKQGRVLLATQEGG